MSIEELLEKKDLMKPDFLNIYKMIWMPTRKFEKIG